MEKILFIGRNYKNGLVNGGNEVTKRNVEILSEIYSVDEILIDFKVSSLRKLWDTIRCNSLNFNGKIKKEIKKMLEINNYKYIWVDSSLYGSIIQYIKKISPNIKIVTFFHNVEYFYFLEKYKVEGIKNLLMLPYSYLNEKRSVKNSNKLITLNERDSFKLEKKYGKKSDIIIPLTLKDKYKEKKYEKIENKIPRALFVGSNFFANIQGIEWFIDNVLPEVNIELIIVGSGMDKLKQIFEEKNNKVKVLGFVDDIGEEYAKADFIVAPIFHGSGMKTKTVEALMFGKIIYGTSEAFEGFELDFDKIGGLCNSKEEYVNIINNKNITNGYSRKIYLEKYSNNSIMLKIKELLK